MCSDYDKDRTLIAVRRAVDLLGGMGQFVKPGELVLIKPNLLKARPPEAAVTTHPEVVRSVIRLVHEAGGAALVGDSPGRGELRKVALLVGKRTRFDAFHIFQPNIVILVYFEHHICDLRSRLHTAGKEFPFDQGFHVRRQEGIRMELPQFQ